MALADVLRARAAYQGRTAPIECGELGVVTVEALPVRELELLSRREDGYRAVFYAACRDLQLAGEQLLREEKVYTPDGILQFVSDAEAEAAAKTIFSLSGWMETADEEAETETSETESTNDEAPKMIPAEVDVVEAEEPAANTEIAGEELRAKAAPAGVEAVEDSAAAPAEVRSARTAPQGGEVVAKQAETLEQSVIGQSAPPVTLSETEKQTETRKSHARKGAKLAADAPEKAVRHAEPAVFGATSESSLERTESAVGAGTGAVGIERSPAEENAAVKTENNRTAASLSAPAKRTHRESADAEPEAAQSPEAREILRETVWLRKTGSPEDAREKERSYETETPKSLRETEKYREAVREDDAALADRVARRLLEGLRQANLVKGV